MLTSINPFIALTIHNLRFAIASTFFRSFAIRKRANEFQCDEIIFYFFLLSLLKPIAGDWGIQLNSDQFHIHSHYGAEWFAECQQQIGMQRNIRRRKTIKIDLDFSFLFVNLEPQPFQTFLWRNYRAIHIQTIDDWREVKALKSIGVCNNALQAFLWLIFFSDLHWCTNRGFNAGIERFNKIKSAFSAFSINFSSIFVF